MPSAREIAYYNLKDLGAPAEHIRKWICKNYDDRHRDGGTALMVKIAREASQYLYKKHPEEWCRRMGVYDTIRRTNEIIVAGQANGSWGSFRL